MGEKMRVVITGGAGFIASHITERLLDKSEKIYLIDNLIITNNLRNFKHLLNDKFEFIKRNCLSKKTYIYFHWDV